jgi:hypothetical protein
MGARFEQLAANLHRWTTPHPLWREGYDDDAGGWPRDVASHVYVKDGTTTITDTQAGKDDPELWAFLADRTEGAERIVVALTASWHRRSSGAVIERYGGEIRLHRFAADEPVMRDLEPVRPFDSDGEIAPGVEALLIGGYDSGEVVYWLPEHGAAAVDAAGLRMRTRPGPPPPPARRLGAGGARAAARCSRTPGR